MKGSYFLLFIFILALTACQSKPVDLVGEKVRVDGGTYNNINADELDSMLKKKILCL